MADSKITALTSIGTSTDPANDPLVIVDVSDTSMAASGTTKKVTLNNLLACSPTATLASATITGDLTVDTSTFKVDSTNNRVGIGTASPSHLLDILATGASTATSSFAMARITGASAVANDLTLIGPNTSQVRVNFGDVDSSSVGEVGYDHSTNRMRFVVSGNEQYRIDPSGVFTWLDGAGGTRMTLNSTGLGIGATPAERLTIGSTTAANYIKLTNSGATTGFLIGSFNTSVDIKNREAGTMNFFTSDTQRMQIDSSGNVGIGVTPSAARLEVGGQDGTQFYIRSTGTTPSKIRGFTNAAEAGVIGFLNGGGIYFDVSGERMRIDSSGNVISNVTGTAPTLATNSQMVFNLTSNTNLRISVRGTDGTTRTANITLA